MKNIRHDRYGTQAYFRHDGRFISNRWKARDYPDEQAREQLAATWLKRARAYAELDQPIPDQPEPRGPRFEDDVETYLSAVTSMPSYTDRERDMRRWAAIFRGRERDSITPLEIRTQLEVWRRTLTGSTCNKRRTALMSFYTRLNGKSGYNPVRDVERYDEENDEPRAQHPYTIRRVLALMRRPRVRGGGRGPKRVTPTLARLLVILTTGWPHAQIKRLKPEHLDLKHARAYVTPRRKGKGRKGAWLPLLPAAVQALTLFDRVDAYTKKGKDGKPQPFSHSAMHSAFARAVDRLNAHRGRLNLPALSIRPYDLRHTFVTALARVVTDERALQTMALHSRIEQTRRYSEQATAGRVERALLEAGLATLATKTLHKGDTRVRAAPEGKTKPARNTRKVKRARQDSNLRPPA